MATNRTGYLYAWGSGSSLENYVPNLVTGILASGISAGPDYNLAILWQPTPTPTPTPSPTPTPTPTPTWQYTFEIFNQSKVDCIDEIEFVSTYTSGSGAFLSNDLITNITEGPVGSEYNRALVSVGRTLGSGSGISSGFLSSGLVAYWKLDEFAGSRFSQIGQNNTLLQSGIVNYATGLYQSAAGFGSASRTNYLNSTGIVFGPNYSVSCWFNAYSMTGIDQFPSIWTIGTRSGTNAGNQVLVLADRNSTGLGGWVYDAVDVVNIGQFQPWRPNRWNHVVWTCANGTDLKLYWNGSLVDSYSNAIVRSFTGFGLGGYILANGTMINPFSGAIDEVAIWDRTISQLQISTIYNAGSGRNLLYTNNDRYTYPSDTLLDVYKNSQPYKSGDSWLEYSGEFAKFNYTGIATGDAGIIISDYLVPDLYNVNFAVKDRFLPQQLVRQGIRLKNLKFTPPTYSVLTSDSKVWASYEISTGNSMLSGSKSVFSYAVELVRDLTSDAIIVNSGFNEQNQLNFQKSLKAPSIQQAVGTSFDIYSGFCFDSVECEDKEPPKDVIICYTGVTTGAEYDAYISGIKKQFSDEKYVKNYDGTSSTSVVSTSAITTSAFSVKTGELRYNNFLSGDRVSFSLYGFDYTGLYKQYHLNNNPPFPTTGFSLSYPSDFTGIDSLVSSLNNRLFRSYQVWYPYECLSGEASGIYLTGNLMSFEKLTGSQYSGTEDFNNVIRFRSLRNYSSGFNLSLSLVDRSADYSENFTKLVKNGFTYLIPDVIELQGQTNAMRSLDGRWAVLDRRSGLYNDLTGLDYTVTKLNLPKNNFLASGQGIVSSEKIYPVTYTGESIVLIENIISGGFQNVLDLTQLTSTPVSDYCGGVLRSSRSITVKVPTGWQSGVNGCLQTGKGEGGPCAQWGKQLGLPLIEDPSFCRDSSIQYIFPDIDCYLCTGTKASGYTPPQNEDLYLSFLRTGWNLDPTGTYLNCWLSTSGYDITNLNFDRYRIVARNFSGIIPEAGKDNYLIPKNETYFKNFNLFSAVKTGIGLHSGPKLCSIGSDYIANIGDIRPLEFNANYNYSINSESMSGMYRAFNEQVVYTPLPSEINVKFANRSGKFVGNVTGLLTRNFIGTGNVSQTFGDYYFYDTGTKEVTFEKVYTKYLPSGSGFLSGTEIVIKPSIVARANSVGGLFATASVYVTGRTSGQFTALLTGASYTETGVTGYFNLTGITGGLSNSGYYNNTFLATGSGSYVNMDNYPYYPIVTGLVQSSGIINVDVTKLQNFDYVSINDKVISYNNDTLNYLAPDFFSSRTGLIDIVNTNSTVFSCTGYAIGSSGIVLVSTLSGASGNFINLISSGSGVNVSNATLANGKTYYLRMFPTSNFSGITSVSFASTGFYSGFGSGFITGNINKFTGVRTFTGTWDIETGINSNLVSYRDKNLLSGLNYYSSIQSNSIGTRSSVIQVRSFYENTLGTLDTEETDVADIVISGRNFGPSGSGITFRLVGVKNL